VSNLRSVAVIFTVWAGALAAVVVAVLPGSWNGGRPEVERARIQPIPSEAARPKTAKMPATLWLSTGP
jgi:hypothetical protein